VFGKGSAFFLSITPSTAAAGHRSLGIGSAFVPLVLQAMAVDAEHKLHELDKPFGVAVL
jgi:hypothetical protein